MLSDLLDEGLVQLGVEATDWEDAVRKSVAPLVELGMATAGYVDDIVRGVRELGPYVVVAPHVALPHARPESGALRAAIGVVTLASPVPFGSEENDPVRFLFPLAATDSDGHLGALQALVELLRAPAFLGRLERAASAAEVVEIIREMEGAPE